MQETENQLQEIKCTRRQLMEFLRSAYLAADPHLFIEEWTSHARALIYGSCAATELIISTDFSAQYDHKAAWTNTCEHPPR